MGQIERLKQQIEAEQRRLDETQEAIASVTSMLASERDYTQQLVRQSQPKPEPIAPPQKPTISKADRVAAMSDQELLSAMGNPKEREKLFKDL
jgi:hypothetical protein